MNPTNLPGGDVVGEPTPVPVPPGTDIPPTEDPEMPPDPDVIGEPQPEQAP
jgi:hypothetical protein